MLVSRTDGRPYINVIFGNFYSPAYDDESFIDDTMQLIKELGFNSVMFDTKAWEDFKERYDTGALSQYVKMQEYMGASAREHGLGYNFLLLYLMEITCIRISALARRSMGKRRCIMTEGRESGISIGLRGQNVL